MAARRTKLIMQLAEKSTNKAVDKESKDVVRPSQTEDDPLPKTWSTDLTLNEDIILSAPIIFEDDIVTEPSQNKDNITFN